MRGRYDLVSSQPSTREPEGHFDAVVVGSGFGGAVTDVPARRGRDVGLPARTGPGVPARLLSSQPLGDGSQLLGPSKGLHGLFDVWSFRGLGGIVASGLGGGSLLWSNVVLRKDPATFVQEEGEYWPVGYEDLVPHYERHEGC